MKVLKTVEVSKGDSFARIEPCERLELDVTIDFSDDAIGRQNVKIVPDVKAFRERLASARNLYCIHDHFLIIIK